MRIFIITGVGRELNKKLSQEVGADRYIAKPFSLPELREKIDKLLTMKKIRPNLPFVQATILFDIIVPNCTQANLGFSPLLFTTARLRN